MFLNLKFTENVIKNLRKVSEGSKVFEKVSGSIREVVYKNNDNNSNYLFLVP